GVTRQRSPRRGGGVLASVFAPVWQQLRTAIAGRRPHADDCFWDEERLSKGNTSLAYVVIWQGSGGNTSHCRVFKEQASAEQVAGARRSEGAVVTVVDTQWGGRAVISSDFPGDESQPGEPVGAQAGSPI
ncbi:MAG: hypothetical protein WAT58_09580, partial [Candidatus Dormiibacterota bacterium]